MREDQPQRSEPWGLPSCLRRPVLPPCCRQFPSSPTRIRPPRVRCGPASASSGSRRSGSIPARSATSPASTATSNRARATTGSPTSRPPRCAAYLDEIGDERPRHARDRLHRRRAVPQSRHSGDARRCAARAASRCWCSPTPCSRCSGRSIKQRLHRRCASASATGCGCASASIITRLSCTRPSAARRPWPRRWPGSTGWRRTGFQIAIAGRTCWHELEEEARAGYARADRGRTAGRSIPPIRKALMLLPEMDGSHDVPEITTALLGHPGQAARAT